jgi:hypothetical protein
MQPPKLKGATGSTRRTDRRALSGLASASRSYRASDRPRAVVVEWRLWRVTLESNNKDE